MKIQHWLLSIDLWAASPSSNKDRCIELLPGGIQGTYGGASSPFSCLLPWQVVGRVGSPSSRFSFTVAPLPGMSVLPWRHLLFGWTACCMPPDHCVEILHLHCPRYHLCFDRRAHCHCLLSHSHPHCYLSHHCSLYHHRSLRHHCSLCHNCSLRHHWLKDCHPHFCLLACLGGYVLGLQGRFASPSLGDPRPGVGGGVALAGVGGVGGV